MLIERFLGEKRYYNGLGMLLFLIFCTNVTPVLPIYVVISQVKYHCGMKPYCLVAISASLASFPTVFCHDTFSVAMWFYIKLLCFQATIHFPCFHCVNAKGRDGGIHVDV